MSLDLACLRAGLEGLGFPPRLLIHDSPRGGEGSKNHPFGIGIAFSVAYTRPRSVQSTFKVGTIMALYRHGDLLVADADTLPKDARQLRHLVLAEGELTGHSHRVAERDAALLFEANDGLFLRVTAERATLVHQEHGPIPLPRGLYRVWRQREYSPQEIRIVRD